LAVFDGRGRLSSTSKVYRIYGERQLPKTIAVDLEGIRGLLKGLGVEAAGANPANFVDASLMEEIEREGSLQQKGR
jgi:hypothetical protein